MATAPQNFGSSWRPLLARITQFPSAPPTGPFPSALDLFRRAWGIDPDNFQRSPNPLVPSSAQGRRQAILLSCTVHPARIDFNLNAASTDGPTSPTSLDLIQDARQLHTELEHLIGALGAGPAVPTISRVALSAQFVKASSTISEANRTLLAVIPEKYRVNLDGEEDFAMQINLPHTSPEVRRVRINSLTKWSVERIRVLAFSLPTDATQLATFQGLIPSNSNSTEFITASVLFDMNNAVVERALTGQEQASILGDSLTAISTTQSQIGLNVEGFSSGN